MCFLHCMVQAVFPISDLSEEKNSGTIYMTFTFTDVDIMFADQALFDGIFDFVAKNPRVFSTYNAQVLLWIYCCDFIK